CILRELIVSYARPFSGNQAPSGGGHSLSRKFVPPEHRALHTELLDLRMQVITHSDFTYHDPRVMQWGTGQHSIFPMSFRRPGYKGLLSRAEHIRKLVDAVDARLQAAIREIEARHLQHS